jgi:type IV pilus assembly protein PilE
MRGFMGSQRGRAVRGFTLIEVMIAVAIVAILATLAYPSYLDSVRKSNGRALQGFLMDVSTRQNQYLLDKRQYAATLSDLGVAAPADVARHYTVAVVVAATPPSFELTATAVAGSPQLEGGWNEIKLNSAGTKLPAGKW